MLMYIYTQIIQLLISILFTFFFFLEKGTVNTEFVFIKKISVKILLYGKINYRKSFILKTNRSES